MKKKITQQDLDRFSQTKLLPSELKEGVHYNGEDQQSYFSHSDLQQWKMIDYKNKIIHVEEIPLITLVQELKANENMETKVIKGASGLKYNQGFLSETMGEMVYKGNNIGEDSKGRKHEIIETHLKQSDDDFLRGIRMRFYKTRLVK